MSDLNYYFKKLGKSERQILASATDLECIYDWLDSYKEKWPNAEQESESILARFPFHPPDDKEDPYWISESEIKDLIKWHSYYKASGEKDKAFIKKLEEALDPKPPKKEEKK